MLGVGDLHPGGGRISELLVSRLAQRRVRRVLEIGAGIGSTTLRMLHRGFEVTCLEPNPVLGDVFARRTGMRAEPIPFEHFEGAEGSYDAILDESVFYAFDIPGAFGKVHRLLRREGMFAFSELLWTPAANEQVARYVHDQTRDVLGIPMMPRTLVTPERWSSALRGAGFSEIAALGEPIASGGDPLPRARTVLALLRRPWLVAPFLIFRELSRVAWAPPGWVQSVAGVCERR
jgi:SAM-dependent methyltransferase